MSNDIKKINIKYCTKDKAQMMLSAASNSIVFSANELLYYNDDIMEIHKYLADNNRKFMPYHKVPKTKKTTTHLFHFNDIYIHFSDNLYIEQGFFRDSYGYGLNTMLLKKLNDETVTVENHTLSDFEHSDYEFITDANGVKNFLYMNDNNENFKAILTQKGIMYACSKKDGLIVNKYKIGLSDLNVLKKYNKEEEPLRTVFSYGENGGLIPKTAEEKLKEKLDTSWKKHSAREITDYSLVMHRFDMTYPMLVNIVGEDITISKFDIRYISTNQYKILEEKYCISKEKFVTNDPNAFDKLSSSYLLEPTIEEIADIAIDENKKETPVKKLSMLQRFKRSF